MGTNGEPVKLVYMQKKKNNYSCVLLSIYFRKYSMNLDAQSENERIYLFIFPPLYSSIAEFCDIKYVIFSNSH